jgi:hypothetical protein
MKTRKATEIFDKILYSSIDDYQTYPVSIYSCDKCDAKLSFSIKDLEKHRFGSFSNLSSQDQTHINEIAADIFSDKDLKSDGQNEIDLKNDKRATLLKRIMFAIHKMKAKFSPQPPRIRPKPDSFIDFYCPKCKRPVRIYYTSFLGGRHCEHGYNLDYVID